MRKADGIHRVYRPQEKPHLKKGETRQNVTINLGMSLKRRIEYAAAAAGKSMTDFVMEDLGVFSRANALPPTPAELCSE